LENGIGSGRGMNDYVPAARWKGGHRMTIYTWARPRRFPGLPSPEARLFRVAADTQVLADCHWQRQPRSHPTLLALHGLEGSSRAHYMRGIAHKALGRGFNVVLLNQRNCGGTEHLSPGLYHSGLTADPAAVIRELIEVDGLTSIGVAGYSLGGNVAVKLAGDYGNACPPEVRSFCAVSPTLELAACTEMLERRENRLYEWNFMRSLKGRMRRKHRLFPDRYPINGLRAVRTVRAFDDCYTAPHHGFNGAADYYHRASAMRVVDRISVPTLIISAEDDPFIPVTPLSAPELVANPFISIVITRHGGHCGFVADGPAGYDGYWAEQRTVEFSAEHASLESAGQVLSLLP
jgi:predicted alpha/beta-fold hydrolase